MDITPAQWAAIGIAVLLLVWPNLSKAKSLLAAAFSKLKCVPIGTKTAVVTDEDNLAAFKVIQAKLPPELRKSVWESIQPKAEG